MKQAIRVIIITFLGTGILFCQTPEKGPGTETPTGKQPQNNYGDPSEGSDTQNRLPHLLADVKMLLSDALIADVHGDTLEVIYTLDRIFDLLTEADQLGDMNEDDQEEFDRFESSLIELYVHRFKTLEKIDADVTAELMRREITDIVEPLEVEMGASQFTVVDDRDGHIPLVRNKRVDQFIEFFKTKGRRQFKRWLARANVYAPMIRDIIEECNLPAELVYLAMIESGFNPRAYSRASATGMWQFVYSTGKKYGLQRNWYIDERRDPIKSTRAACAYLRDLYEEFDSWYLALAAYNAGSGRIHRASRIHQTSDFWQLHSLPAETRNYIPYFLAATIIALNPEDYGFTRSKKGNKPFTFDEVLIEKSADLSVLARTAKISLKTLKQYNPELRQSATPTEPYLLKLPTGKKDLFLANYNALPENERFAPQYVVHKVRKGESLWTISKKYRVSIHDLAAVNKIRNRHQIRMGQKLTIPISGTNLASMPAPSALRGYSKFVYQVKKGDTLGHIAENYGTRASSIRKWNGLRYGDYIYPGQKLVLWIKQG
ncbi:MAG: LysM peptidoglycan-binding domain-containing protein [Fidelibacterota bacterium]